MKSIRSTGQTGFSLCEVAIAMGIFTFVAVSILGLLPTAMTSARESLDVASATQLAGSLASHMSRKNFSALQNGSTTKYFDHKGNESTVADQATYQAIVAVEDSDSENLKRVRISVSRPAAASPGWNFCYLIFNHDR